MPSACFQCVDTLLFAAKHAKGESTEKVENGDFWAVGNGILCKLACERSLETGPNIVASVGDGRSWCIKFPKRFCMVGTRYFASATNDWYSIWYHNYGRTWSITSLPGLFFRQKDKNHSPSAKNPIGTWYFTSAHNFNTILIINYLSRTRSIASLPCKIVLRNLTQPPTKKSFYH